MAYSSTDFSEKKKDAVIDTNRKIRVGIVGCGWIAEAHLISYLNCPDVEVVAACDLIPGKAKALLDRYNLTDAKTDYPSHKEMIDDKSLELDAISVCTYNRQHAAPCIYGLENGLHVLVEKPFTVTLDEAVEVMKAEKASGKVLSIGFQPRFDANMRMIKKIVESGELGKVYYVQTGGGRRKGIPTPLGTSFIENETAGLGALADIGCYSLDMVLNALGHPKPLTVTGYKSDFFGKNPASYPGHPEYADKFGVDDFAAGFIRLENDIIIDFRISWAMHMDNAGDTLILGTKGGLRIPSTECWNGSVGGAMRIFHDVCGEPTDTVVPILPSGEDLFLQKVRAFLDAIKNGTPSPIPSSQIIYNQAILDGIARSAELGREVTIEIPEI